MVLRNNARAAGREFDAGADFERIDRFRILLCTLTTGKRDTVRPFPRERMYVNLGNLRRT
jgi:hypothetical protein